jgi:SAM-dependent methyltransferase
MTAVPRSEPNVVSPPSGAPEPDALLLIAAGFMSAKFLMVACEIGLFAQLGKGPATLDELAAALNIPRRPLRIVADAMRAEGLLRHDGERYENSVEADLYLTGKTPIDFRPGFRMYDRVFYRQWMNLEEAVRTGRAPDLGGALSAQDNQIFSMGVEALTAMGANGLSNNYDFTPHRKILDIGGGTGSFLLRILARHPHLAGTLFELPTAVDVARMRLKNDPVASRIEIVEGDVFFDKLPDDHDVVLLAHLLHFFTPEKNTEMFKRIRQHVRPGARLLAVDLWMNETFTAPRLAGLLAGQFMLLSGDGDVFHPEQAKGWLETSGWRWLGHRPAAGVVSVVVGEAI